MSEPTSNLDKILRQVAALMAHSEDPGNTPEAQETYRQKAEALMFKYRVTENEAASAAVGQAAAAQVKPVWRTLLVCRIDNEFQSTYRYMAATALGHVDGKGVTTTIRNPQDDNRWWYAIEAVGYESDLRYSEVLYNAMHLAFAGKMEPRLNPSLSEAENAYNMRSAGMEGRRIALALWGSEDKHLRVKARKLFAQHAASLGEDPSVLLGRGNLVATYRTSYAEGFEAEMWSRLNRMRISHGDSGELVLASRKTAVQEAFYDRYPSARPRPTAPAGRSIGGRDTCDKCKKAKSGYCREHAYLKPRAGRYVERSYSSAGYNRGRVAARSAELGGSKGSNRVDGSDTRAIG